MWEKNWSLLIICWNIVFSNDKAMLYLSYGFVNNMSQFLSPEKDALYENMHLKLLIITSNIYFYYFFIQCR